MSAFVDIKGDFLRDMVRGGWTLPEEVPESWRDSIPPNILGRWFRQLAQPILLDYPNPQRLLNHFKLGADPEFCFVNPLGGERESAQIFGFQAGQAWGADNNGRLAEIRPQPSRYALSVAASIWATLWWMARINPSTLSYGWRSGSYFGGDGMGGHIHFGRKRPTWPREMQALDTLAFWLQHTHILSPTEWRERIRRTAGHGNYGQLSDRRAQAHGWEYRSIPSWLDSPWLAYCILTLSKLAVFDPDLLPPLTSASDSLSPHTARNQMRSLLNYYKGRDDDAALAHAIYTRRGWPRSDVNDFKGRWGVFGNAQTAKPPSFIIPTQIAPTPAQLKELAAAMLEGRAPEWDDAPPTWSPNTLPEGYHLAINGVNTFRTPGLGELLQELVVYTKESAVRFASSGNSQIDIPHTLVPPGAVKWLRQLRAQYPAISVCMHEEDRPDRQQIYIPGEYNSNLQERQQTWDFLTSGWAPIWRVRDVTPTSWAKWRDVQFVHVPTPPKTRPKASRIVWPLVMPTPKSKPKFQDSYDAQMIQQFREQQITRTMGSRRTPQRPEAAQLNTGSSTLGGSVEGYGPITSGVVTFTTASPIPGPATEPVNWWRQAPRTPRD